VHRRARSGAKCALTRGARNVPAPPCRVNLRNALGASKLVETRRRTKSVSRRNRPVVVRRMRKHSCELDIARSFIFGRAPRDSFAFTARARAVWTLWSCASACQRRHRPVCGAMKAFRVPSPADRRSLVQVCHRSGDCDAMASGTGAFGQTGLCYRFWVGFRDCMVSRRWSAATTRRRGTVHRRGGFAAVLMWWCDHATHCCACCAGHRPYTNPLLLGARGLLGVPASGQACEWGCCLWDLHHIAIRASLH